MEIKPDRMISLGYGRFWRSDAIVGLMRIESVAKHARQRPVCPTCKSKKVARVFTPFYAKTVRKS